MKKISLFFVLASVVFFVLFSGCSKTSVTAIATAAPTDYAAFVSVPAGTFTQTDTIAHSFVHTISAFKIGKYEVTYDLWYTVKTWATSNGYVFANAGMEGYDGVRVSGAAPTTAEKNPVNAVSWRDAIVWCNAYSEKNALIACYTYSSAVIKDSTDATACDNAVCTWSNNGYRLPSESEWQYAASYKDGTNWTAYNYASGATADNTDATATGLVAWCYGNSGSVTHEVGTKTANALGIYDMSGNILEWCWDWYGVYPGTAQENYRGPANGSYRINHGGFYDINEAGMAIGSRTMGSTSSINNGKGFRLAKTN